VPLPDDVQSIGYFLTVFDDSLVKWSQLMLGSSSARDQNMLRVLEANMQERARLRFDELLTELESGAPINRRIAAAAVGFAHDPKGLGPLLATLPEPDPELVQRALLGLGVLAMPETPVGEIRARLLLDDDAWTRNNAAFALLAIARAGNTSSALAEACRAGLSDADPGVRAQCASALGELADPDAVAQLAELIGDEADLVALASALSLARIGREHPQQRGPSARALALALESVETERRAHLLGALRWLRGEDLGEDARPWREWAAKLP
jgi:HEAT repeat protein